MLEFYPTIISCYSSSTYFSHLFISPCIFSLQISPMLCGMTWIALFQTGNATLIRYIIHAAYDTGKMSEATICTVYVAK